MNDCLYQRAGPVASLLLHPNSVSRSQHTHSKAKNSRNKNRQIRNPSPPSPNQKKQCKRKNKQKVHKCRSIVSSHRQEGKDCCRHQLRSRKLLLPVNLNQHGRKQQHGCIKRQIIHRSIPPEKHVKCPGNQLNHHKRSHTGRDICQHPLSSLRL